MLGGADAHGNARRCIGCNPGAEYNIRRRRGCARETRTVNDDTLEKIETKIAFLERANAELSDVVFRQHRDIEALREQIVSLASRLQSYQEEVTPRKPEDERPPHY